MPLAIIVGELVKYLERKSSSPVSAIALILVSTAVVLPVIAGLIWLRNLDLHYSIGDLSNVFGVPEGEAFKLSNARMNFIVKYTISFLTAAWGSTALYVYSRARAKQATDKRNACGSRLAPVKDR